VREDERLLYSKLIEVVQGEDTAVSSKAAMHLVATLIVGSSPSLAEAESGAITAGKQIAEMVKLHWGSPLAWRGV
jgi:hypothetical protein